MSGSQEIRKIINDAEGQGFTFERNTSGHYRATAPVGVSGPAGKKVTTISCSPKSPAGVRLALSNLAAIGYIPPKHRQHPQYAAAQQRKQENNGNVVVQEVQETAVSQEIDMAHTSKEPGTYPVRDIVRITGKDLPSVEGEKEEAAPTPTRYTLDKIMPREEIKENLSLAAELVWQQVIDHITSGQMPGTAMPGPEGEPGWRWEHSRTVVINELWPGLQALGQAGLHKPNDIVRAMAGFLKRSHNMYLIKQGSPTQTSVWWIRGSWRQAPLTVMNLSKQDVKNWWEQRVTPQEAGEDRLPEPVTTSFDPTLVERAQQAQQEQEQSRPLPLLSPPPVRATRPAVPSGKPDMVKCPKCSFFDTTMALGSHQGKLAGREHPQGTFPCMLCPRVRSAPAALAQHLVKDHPEATFVVCRVCGKPYQNSQQRARHMSDDHNAYRRGQSVYDRVTESPVVPPLVTEQDVSPLVVPVIPVALEEPGESASSLISIPSSTSSTTVEEARRYLISFLSEFDQLRTDHDLLMRERAGLTKMITQLTAEKDVLEGTNATLTEKVDSLARELIEIRDWLSRNPFGKNA